jgi:hypothetical protein
MNANKTVLPSSQQGSMPPPVTKVNFLHVPIRVRGKDVILNVSFKEALIRFGIALGLPMLMLVIDAHLIVYTTPVLAYLFISGITHFCVFKYLWHRVIKHDPPAPLPPYGQDMNYPEESV